MPTNTPQLSQFNTADLDNLEQRYRAQLINGLSGFKSANLIGTISETGIPNLAIVSSVFHIGANPPLMGMITRPNSVRRDTIENLQATGYFTINHVHKGIYQQAHQTSARYAAEDNEFDKVGLTPNYVDGIPAPYVAESRIRIGLKVEEIKHLDINSTDMVIGRIVQLSLPQNIIQADGHIDIESAETVAVSGLDSYHQTERLDRLSYAKPNKAVTSLVNGIK